MSVKTYANNLDYQELVTAFEKTKDLYKSAKKQHKVEKTASITSKEDEASKAAIALSYFEYKQSKLKQQSEHLAEKTEKLKQKSDKLAVKIVKLKLKACVKSLQKTEDKQSDAAKKPSNSQKKSRNV